MVMIDGVLVIDKPEGVTSFAVVREVRRYLKTKRVGHTGTLDPMATGVLPICVGSATRLVPLLTDGDKEYLATVCLGVSTDTQDRTGVALATSAVPRFSEKELEKQLDCFRGSFDQLPPMYSAIRVQGKRLYELARQGKEIERASRPVTIEKLELQEWVHPYLRLRVVCSKGTYIRSLAHDIGERLGCHAHLSDLRRTRSGRLSLKDAFTLENVRENQSLSACLISEKQALSFLPEFKVGEEQRRKISNGQRLSTIEGLSEILCQERLAGQKLRLSSLDGELLAVIEWRNGEPKYQRVFAA